MDARIGALVAERYAVRRFRYRHSSTPSRSRFRERQAGAQNRARKQADWRSTRSDGNEVTGTSPGVPAVLFRERERDRPAINRASEQPEDRFGRLASPARNRRGS